jgi:hypothetical protein
MSFASFMPDCSLHFFSWSHRFFFFSDVSLIVHFACFCHLIAFSLSLSFLTINVLFFQVLYLGAANGTSVSHVSDVIGPEGVVYGVEFSHRSGRDLINMAKKRTNVVPIVEVCL